MINFFIKIIDLSYQRKKNTFLKKKLFNKIDVFFDIGAHNGDTIKDLIEKFQIKKIYAFEPSQINFDKLNLQINKIKKKNPNIEIEAFLNGVGKENKKIYLNEIIDGVSNTFNNFNEESKYFKRKKFLFSYFGVKNFFKKKTEVNVISLDGFFEKKNIEKVDLIKIDTEGFEYNVLLGLKDQIKKIKFILFEHHYDNMIIKNYKFTDINKLLLNNGFKKSFKIKMPLRKSFDYVYENTNLE